MKMIIKSSEALLKCFLQNKFSKIYKDQNNYFDLSQTFGAERSLVFAFLRPVLLKLLIEDKSWERSGAPDGGPGGGGGGAGGGGPPKINKKRINQNLKKFCLRN